MLEYIELIVNTDIGTSITKYTSIQTNKNLNVCYDLHIWQVVILSQVNLKII